MSKSAELMSASVGETRSKPLTCALRGALYNMLSSLSQNERRIEEKNKEIQRNKIKERPKNLKERAKSKQKNDSLKIKQEIIKKGRTERKRERWTESNRAINCGFRKAELKVIDLRKVSLSEEGRKHTTGELCDLTVD